MTRPVKVGFVDRVGMAIVSPRAALAVAGDRRHAGRSGGDLLLAIVLLVAATQLRALVAAGWLGYAVDAALGARAVVHVLTRTLTVDLGFLVVGAVIVWLGAGNRRELGRAFDLACVAALPLVVVDLGATVVVATAGLDVPAAATWAVSGVAYAWTGVLLALAIGQARRAAAAGQPSRGGAGWLVIAVAGVGLVGQVAFVARHLDGVRPLTTGDRAPAFALRAIGAGGELGDRVGLSAGKLTIVDFWATWCGPCLAALPRLDALARRHPELAVLAIALDEPAQARGVFDQRRYTMTLLADDGEASERYGVTAIPHTVVIDRAGTVRRIARGGGDDLEADVAALAAVQPR